MPHPKFFYSTYTPVISEGLTGKPFSSRYESEACFGQISMFIFLYNLCTIAIGDCFWYRDFFFFGYKCIGGKT